VDDTGKTHIVAVDCGSRAGTRLDGDALVPGQPIPLSGMSVLTLGRTMAIELRPLRDADNVAGLLLRPGSEPTTWCFLPVGGPMWLDADHHAPFRLAFVGGHAVCQADVDVAPLLNDLPLAPGARIELVVGDRVRWMGASSGSFEVSE